MRGCLQNEDLRPKTQKPRLFFFFFSGLSNQGQSNRAKAFPQAPTDAKSVGLRFPEQAGSNYKTKTLA